MGKTGIAIIAAVTGGLIYHFYLKRKGLFDTHRQSELMKDESRISFHQYLDKLTDGEVDEKEIEDRVYKIIQ